MMPLEFGEIVFSARHNMKRFIVCDENESRRAVQPQPSPFSTPNSAARPMTDEIRHSNSEHLLRSSRFLTQRSILTPRGCLTEFERQGRKVRAIHKIRVLVSIHPFWQAALGLRRVGMGRLLQHPTQSHGAWSPAADSQAGSEGGSQIVAEQNRRTLVCRRTRAVV